MEGYFLTDCGKVRDTNEDAGGIFINKSNQVIAGVADGMGGHQAGEIASQMAIDIVKENWEMTDEINEVAEAEKWMGETIQFINERVYSHSLSNEELKGMGTTIVLALCTNDFVVVGHIGDSRCYLWNGETKLTQITSDHSLVNELVRTGQISELDAEEHPRKNVLLKAIGTEAEINPDIKTIEWQENDRLLLCSDGLTNKISDEELEQALATMTNEEETAIELIQLANERGGEDNITLAIVRNKVGETE